MLLLPWYVVSPLPCHPLSNPLDFCPLHPNQLPQAGHLSMASAFGFSPPPVLPFFVTTQRGWDNTVGVLDLASPRLAQCQEPTFAIPISFILPQLKFYEAGGMEGVLSCFLSGGHTPGVRTKTKRKSKGCQSLPKPSTVHTGDRPPPLRHPRPGPRGTPSPPPGGLKAMGGRGPLSGAGG